MNYFHIKGLLIHLKQLREFAIRSGC